MARKSRTSGGIKQLMKARQPRKPKTQPAATSAPGAGHNGKPVLPPDEERALFLRHRGIVEQLRTKEEAAKKLRLDAESAAKVDGFPKKLFAIARDLAGSARKEEKVVCEVRDRLRVARWIGHSLGAQLDLFAEPDRTPSSDHAYDEGKQASMENRAAKPDYAPDTEQYRAYMAGFHDHQQTIGRAFKAPDVDEDGNPIQSGQFVTRSDFSRKLHGEPPADEI